MATKKAKDPLVGKYFHSVKEDRETIVWQGEITARIGDNYLLQLFEWFMGAESNQILFPQRRWPSGKSTTRRKR